MTEILFYHLQRQTVEKVLPTLLEKSLERQQPSGNALGVIQPVHSE